MTELRTGNWLPYERQGNGDKYVMLPLNIKDSEDICSPGGVPASELHVTMGYFGPVTPKDNQQTWATKTRFAAWQFGKPHLKMRVSGIARWELEDKDVIVLLVEGEDIADLRYQILDQLGEDKSEHGFDPHITLGYVAKGEPHPKYSIKTKEIVFDAVVLGFNNKYVRFALADGVILDEMKSLEEKRVRPNTVPKPKVLSTYSARATLRGRKNRRRKVRAKDRINGLRSLKKQGQTLVEFKGFLKRFIRTAEGAAKYGGNIGDPITLDEQEVSLRKPAKAGPAKKPRRPATGQVVDEDTVEPNRASLLANSDGPRKQVKDAMSPIEVFQEARKTAIGRAKAVRMPIPEMIADNKARILEDPQLRSKGVDLRGNREQESKRSWHLFVTFGGMNNGGERDGFIPCIHCGKKLSWYSKAPDGTMAPYEKLEQDKILPTKYGGKYVTHNLLPSCRSCNASRGNKMFHEGAGLEDGKPEFLSDEWVSSLDRIPPKRSPQRGLFEGNEKPLIPYPKEWDDFYRNQRARAAARRLNT